MGHPEKMGPSAPYPPILLHVLPLLAVAVLGVSLFFTASSRQVDSAVVLGGPTDGERFFGRLYVTRVREGQSEPLPNRDLRVSVTQGAYHSQRTVRTGSDGWAQFDVIRKGSTALHLEVTDARGQILARGAPQMSTERWSQSARRRGGIRLVHREGDLSARVGLERPILAVPFIVNGSLLVKRGDLLHVGARVQLELSGAEFSPSKEATARCISDADGLCRFSLRPNQHVVSLRAIVQASEKRIEFDELLPVVPGSYWLSKKPDGSYLVESPIPRDSVWYTFVTSQARLSGGRLSLTERRDGTCFAELSRALVPQDGDLYLVLSSEADGRSPSTVGFPLAGQKQTFDAWDGYLFDGKPQAQRRAELKHRRIRWTLGAYAGLAGLLTLLLFVLRVKAADRALDQALSQVGATAATSDRRALPLVIAVLCLFFAFSLGVLWIVAR